MDPQLLQILSMLQAQQPSMGIFGSPFMMQPQFPAMNGLSSPYIAPGVPIPFSQGYDLSGVPGLNGAPGMIGGMLLQGVMPRLLGPNFLPGQFRPTQNLYDHYAATQYYTQQHEAISLASQSQRAIESRFRTVRGIDRLMGNEYRTQGQVDQAYRTAGDLGGLTAIAASVAPDLLDAISGKEGSPETFARGIFEASRYRFDPATGVYGSIRGPVAAQLSGEAFNLLYGREPGSRNLANQFGIKGGRAGELFEELTRRGLGVPAFLDQNEQKDALAKELLKPSGQLPKDLEALKGGVDGKTTDALSKLRQNLDSLTGSQFETAARSFDATRVARTIERMSGAVAAMRDIFGDMGRPDAPMLEVLNGLDALTQGGLSKLSPNQIENSVRTTYALAKSSGLGLQGLNTFATTAGQYLDAAGMSRLFAPDIAQQSAAYFIGFGATQQPNNFYALSKEQAVRLDIQQRAGAATSPIAGRLGGFIRLAESFTRDDGGQLAIGFAGNTEASAVEEAIRNGRTTYKFNGRERNLGDLGAGELAQILQRAGVGAASAIEATTQSAQSVQAQIYNYGIGGIARNLQGRVDFQSGVVPAITNLVSSRLSGTVSNDRLGAVSTKVGAGLSEEISALFDKDPNLLSDTARVGTRNNILIQQLRARFGDDLKGISDVNLSNIISESIDRADSFIRDPRSRLSGYGGLTGILQQARPRTEVLARQAFGSAQGAALLQRTLTGLGQESVLSRLSTAIQNAPPGGGSIEDILKSVVGAVPTAEAAPRVAALLEKATELRFDYERTKKLPESAATKGKLQEIEKGLGALRPDIVSALEGRTDFSPAGQALINQYQERKKEEEKITRGALGTARGTTAQQVDIAQAKDVKITADKVTLADGKGAGAQGVAPSSVHITGGTLRITGLDKSTLRGILEEVKTVPAPPVTSRGTSR